MIRTAALVLSAATMTYMAPSAAFAQDAPPTYQADPSVYKVIFDDQDFRVIKATWKAGQTDKPHSHPVPSIVYFLTDCSIKLKSADGKTRDVKNKAGQAGAVPIEHSHTATNLTHHTCQALFVERK